MKLFPKGKKSTIGPGPCATQHHEVYERSDVRLQMLRPQNLLYKSMEGRTRNRRSLSLQYGIAYPM